MWCLHKNSVAGKGKMNEDFADWRVFDDGSVLAVLADGMGSLGMADQAAELAVNLICDYFKSSEINDSDLQAAVLNANDAILAKSVECRCRMGCAITVLYLNDRCGKFISLGNVRVYTYSKEMREKQISQDDLYIASNGNRFLSQCLSGKELNLPLTVNTFPIDGIDVIKLSTDGAYNKDTEDDATEILIRRNARNS